MAIQICFNCNASNHFSINENPPQKCFSCGTTFSGGAENQAQERTVKQYLYILSNPSMPGLIKIGKTKTHPNQRMTELHSTGVPTPFDLEFSVEIDNCDTCEKIAHNALQKYRLSENREFFKISVANALKLILPVIGNYKIHEVKSAHDIEVLEREVVSRKLQDEREAAAKIADEKQRELERKLEIEKHRKAVEVALAEEQKKLGQLGSRPVEKELPSFLAFLGIAAMPLIHPIGWIIYAVLLVFMIEQKKESAAIISILILVVGYICNNIGDTYRSEYLKAYAPFEPIESKIRELKAELDKLNKHNTSI